MSALPQTGVCMIVNAGISEVVFTKSDRYEAGQSLEILRGSGVEVTEI